MRIKRRIVTIAVIAALILSFAGLSTTALAADPYTLTDADVTVVSGEITAYSYAGGGDVPTDIIIPDTLHGQNVTSIGSHSFFSKGLTSVTIPEGVTKIGDYAFRDNQLTSITIPSSVQTIEEGAFGENLLKSVTIPEGVTEIADYVFMYNQLTSITIPSSVKTIGYMAFYDSLLSSVTIPEGVTQIGDHAFNQNKLESITIPSSVKTIGYASFYGNLLSSVTIPKGVTQIGDQAFCSNKLESITIPSSVKTIGQGAFYGNLLSSVTIPEGVTEISDSAFCNNQLESITIPSSVQTIGFAAFQSNQLSSVTIPEGVTQIGNQAFFQNQLKSITIPSSVQTIGNYSFSENLLESVTMHEGVTEIGIVAFSSNQLKSITIPSSVQTIGQGAFQSNLLSSATIPEGVTEIGVMAFSSNQLESITIPSSVQTIGGGAFQNNKLSSVTILEGVTEIGAVAFSYNHITSITIPSSVSNISFNAFSNNNISQITLENDATNLYSNCFDPQTVNGQSITQWYGNKEYTGGTVDIYGARSGATTYYAHYTANVDFQENGGSAVADVTGQNAHTLAAKPEDPAKDGYFFRGWYLDDETFENAWDFNNDTLTQDIVLYAKWYKPVASVTLDKDKADMIVGDETTLTATVLPADATYPEITWTSSNENVATVDANGKITAVGEGNTTITATADGKSATCTVTVTSIDVTSITLDKDKADMTVGGETTLTATVLPADATYPEVTWTSSNENVATVDSGGKVKAVGVGNAVITATADGKTAECKISVTSDETTPADAPKGNIRGRLVDSDGNPMAGYPVTLHSDPITVITDSNGVFVYENVPLTNHTLIIEAKDGAEIGRYALSFEEGDSTSYVTGEKEVDITSTANTVAIDVLVRVSEDGKSTTVDKVTFVENPDTGDTSQGGSLWWIAIIAGLAIAAAGVVVKAKMKKA